MDNNNTNNNKPNNKVNMPKFNLNWLYMIIALMLLGLWWSSDSRGSGSKLVPYSDFQKYVTNGYISWINFCRTKKQPVILTESQITLPIRIFSRQS